MPRGGPQPRWVQGTAIPGQYMQPQQRMQPSRTARPPTSNRGPPPQGAAGPRSPQQGAQQRGGKVPGPVQGQGQAFTYSKNARNYAQQQPAVQPAPAVQQAPQGLPQQPGQEPLTTETLASMDPQEAKNALGERLFMKISEHTQLAAKVTGMLLELDNTELLNLLESPEVLQSKIQEAQSILSNADQPY
eukprot:350724_1